MFSFFLTHLFILMRDRWRDQSERWTWDLRLQAWKSGVQPLCFPLFLIDAAFPSSLPPLIFSDSHLHTPSPLRSYLSIPIDTEVYGDGGESVSSLGVSIFTHLKLVSISLQKMQDYYFIRLSSQNKYLATFSLFEHYLTENYHNLPVRLSVDE